MALCINCNIARHANQQQLIYNVMDMDNSIISIIEEWTAREVADGDTICQQCMDLVMREYNNRYHGNRGDQQLGHAAVCICCGISISQRSGRRSRPLLVGHRERDYIANIISPRQMSDDARACQACWLRAYNNIPEAVEKERIFPNVLLESGSSSVVELASVHSSEFERGSVNQIENINLDGYSRTPIHQTIVSSQSVQILTA